MVWILLCEILHRKRSVVVLLFIKQNQMSNGVSVDLINNKDHATCLSLDIIILTPACSRGCHRRTPRLQQLAVEIAH